MSSPSPSVPNPTKRVVDGPFSGASLPASTGKSVLLTGDGVPDGEVARYRFSAGAMGYMFQGFDKVVASLPWPPEGAR